MSPTTDASAGQTPPPGPEPTAVETTLADPQALWQAVCEASSDYFAVVDTAGVIRFISRVDDGFSMDQVVGHHIDSFTTPESAVLVRDAVADVFRSGAIRSLETTVRRLNGGVNYFSLTLAPIRKAGAIPAIMVTCRSILPLKESERTLQRERAILHRLLEIQEQERQLVSYEIHDGLAQYLAGAMMQLQALEHSAAFGRGRELRESLRLLQAAIDESRRLISGLRPPALDELGIVDAVQSLVADARLDIPAVSFTHDLPADRLAPQLETAIFRIIQESLSNARRHSRAQRVDVRIERRQPEASPRIHVAVRDDGIGFDPASVPEDRFGLEGIRQRSRILGAEADIRSTPGQGTVVEVDLPFARASV